MNEGPRGECAAGAFVVITGFILRPAHTIFPDSLCKAGTMEQPHAESTEELMRRGGGSVLPPRPLFSSAFSA
jgi:hypothetical protein